MNPKLLCHQDYRLCPNARWLLLQWSSVVGLDQQLNCSLKEICRLLGMTAQQVRPALNQLKLLGYINQGKLSRGRGRPASSFQISEKLCHDLEKLELPQTAHLQDIDGLCERAIIARNKSSKDKITLMRGVQEKHKFSPATYWLVAVLLSRCATPGVVTGLSYRGLIALTGMTRERLKSQLTKLKNIGVVAYHQPGVLREKGNVRLSSVYFLDISHPVIKGLDSVGLAVFFCSQKSESEFSFLNGFYEAALVYSELNKSLSEIKKRINMMSLLGEEKASYEGRKKGFELGQMYSSAYKKLFESAKSLLPAAEYIEPAVKAFVRLRGLDVGPIVEAHILSYAVTLLSNHWFELGNCPFNKVIKPVIAAIEADCSSLMTLDDCPKDNKFALAKALYALAVNVALRLRQELRAMEAQQSDFDFASGIFLIKRFMDADKDFLKLSVCFNDSDGVTYLKDTLVMLDSVSLVLPRGLKPLVQTV